ncbi:hypothetical protein [Nostoc sp.]|uniref:hypothetical protein n=1 Tax=Nostoc sp. TaxID=1180 RepID=UPI002FF5DEE1
MSTNPRQFSSLDNGDRGMGESLTNRPATGAPVGDPIDFDALKRQVSNERRQPGYQWKETSGEATLERQRQIDLAIARKQEYAQEQAAREIQTAREQASRQELQNRIRNNEPADSEVATPRGESPLAQQQRSTPERQPLPSTGRTPPTLNGTAARANPLIEPTATPAPAALKEAIAATAGNAISALPRALPQAAGRLVIPGVGAALSIGTRLVVGQSVTQAVTSTGAGLIGTGIGAIVGTAIGGPIGGVVGGMIGGTAASLFSDWLFAQNLPTAVNHLETFTPNYPAFIGGQEPGAAYQVTYTYKILYDGQTQPTTFNESSVMFGPVSAPVLYKSDTGMGALFHAFDYVGNPKEYQTSRGGSGTPISVSVQSVTYLYGGRGQESPVILQNPTPPPDNSPYRYDSSPVGNDNVIPSGIPGAGKNNGEARSIAPSMPSNNTPNGARGFVGHGGLAPSYLPNPEHQPSNLGGMLPAVKNAPQPLPFAEPEDIPVPRAPTSEGTATTTATNPSTFAYPTYVPQVAQPIPISDALSPVPAKTQPIPKTPEQIATDKTNETIEQQKKDFDDQIKRLTAIATGLAALTPAIQGIPDAIANSPTVQAANRETTQGAVCEIAQPGGCLGNALENSANNINQNNNQNTANLLDKINAGANAAQLALLELINTKLGDLLPGGLSGTFSRLWQTLQVDRILNILILITTFHNALMLSNNLAQTLFAAIDNISQAVGFKWKNEKGEESGFGSIVSEWTADFFKLVFGEENYTELVANYKKANRIYQATANIFNALQSIGYSILSALEVVGSYVALIGNALRKWGEVGETAYKWFNPQPNFHNKFFTTLEGATNVVSQIDQVASEVVSVEQNVAQIGELKNELGKSIGEEHGSKQGVQPPEATKVKAAFDASKIVSAIGIELDDTDFEADEGD